MRYLPSIIVRLIMGGAHFLRGLQHLYIEPQLRLAGAKTYLIVFGTNSVGSYDDLDHRFESWPAPVIVPLAGSWVGELPADPVMSGGLYQGPPSGTQTGRPPTGAAASLTAPLRLKDAAAALLYLGPRDILTKLWAPRAEVDGTPYGKEFQRRLKMLFAETIDIVPEKDVAPQFPRPQLAGKGVPMRFFAPFSCGNNCMLPPRPESQ